MTTEPGGDEELIYLYSGGAGKGLFRADLDTRLGQVTKHDKVLELTGKDIIKCDYPEEFEAEFRSVPLSDAEIRVAANAKLDVSGSKIVDLDTESFSQRLERASLRRKPGRTAVAASAGQSDQAGNSIYPRVQDADRDLSDQPERSRSRSSPPAAIRCRYRCWKQATIPASSKPSPPRASCRRRRWPAYGHRP